tara:strand:- start:536 stop:1018 length:483 start_codon:yes stop_codon:yes gene_type:complete
MTAKFTVLGNTTLATASSTVTFSSIPGGHKDLVLVLESLSASGSNLPIVRLNNDSGSNYTYVSARGSGSSASSNSGTDSGIYSPGMNGSSTDKQLSKIEIFDYSATDKHKTVLLRSGQIGEGTVMSAFRWADTSAITSLVVQSLNNNFAAGSTFRLLGVN